MSRSVERQPGFSANDRPCVSTYRRPTTIICREMAKDRRTFSKREWCGGPIIYCTQRILESSLFYF